MLELLVDGPEQVALVGEVVVERATGDPGTGDDLLGADAGVATLSEQVAADAQERVAGGIAATLPFCEDFKEVQALEEQLRSDPSVVYFEVHVYAMIKSWTAPLDNI